MSESFTCSHCGTTRPMSERHWMGDEELCPSCLVELTVICHECGTRIWANENHGTGTLHLCEICYNDHYTRCHHCGELIRQSEANFIRLNAVERVAYCDDCFEELPKEGIQEYFYKPTPFFYGEGNRFLGVELEIDGGGEYIDSANSILSIGNEDGPRIYCKHDGSLDEGFEIVTHPMTLQYHQEDMPWKRILRKAIQLGYTSHQAGTCGLHVHVNRDSLGATAYGQEETIARILYFVEKHWEELLKFSRRTESQLNRWAARYGYKDQPMEILDDAKGSRSGRYWCVNLQNEHTIEFRIFRGTLKLNTLIATLQLVNRICDVALSLSDKDLKALSWTSFVGDCNEPELVQYMKERRIYVNDYVSQEVEI